MLVDTKQELNVVLRIPVYIKVGYLDPASQLEPARKWRTVKLNAQHMHLSNHQACAPSYICSCILLISLSRVGGHNFVQRLELFLMLDDGLGVDLHS